MIRGSDMSDKVAARLTSHARHIGLDGDVVYMPNNGVGWRYQWCPPDCSKTRGLGDSGREALESLDSADEWDTDD